MCDVEGVESEELEARIEQERQKQAIKLDAVLLLYISLCQPLKHMPVGPP